jgi:hypothetical protein
MKRFIVLIAVSGFFGCSSTRISDTAGTELAGTWRGTSLCTPLYPRCRDEIAVYHIAPSPNPGTVSMTMNKEVDGNEVDMGGTVQYRVDYTARTLTSQSATRDGTPLVLTLTWSGNKMTGTLIQLPGREVIRNITLERK